MTDDDPQPVGQFGFRGRPLLIEAADQIPHRGQSALRPISAVEASSSIACKLTTI
jgi:hypothetical protein